MLFNYLLRDNRPQLVNVDGGAEVLLLRQVEVAHADLAEVTRMALVRRNQTN